MEKKEQVANILNGTGFPRTNCSAVIIDQNEIVQTYRRGRLCGACRQGGDSRGNVCFLPDGDNSGFVLENPEVGVSVWHVGGRRGKETDVTFCPVFMAYMKFRSAASAASRTGNFGR